MLAEPRVESPRHATRRPACSLRRAACAAALVDALPQEWAE